MVVKLLTWHLRQSIKRKCFFFFLRFELIALSLFAFLVNSRLKENIFESEYYILIELQRLLPFDNKFTFNDFASLKMRLNFSESFSDIENIAKSSNRFNMEHVGGGARSPMNSETWKWALSVLIESN